MTREELKAWLETLKPGDEVAFNAAEHWYRNQWVILTVERTTKTQIVMRDGAKFRTSDGCQVGSGSWKSLKPVTDEIRAETHRRIVVHRYHKVASAVDRYTTEQLEAVIALLTGDKETP